jgi:hypothetical protein
MALESCSRIAGFLSFNFSIMTGVTIGLYLAKSCRKPLAMVSMHVAAAPTSNMFASFMRYYYYYYKSK